MGFFDLIQQHQAVGLAADNFGELATFFVANVAGWGTDQARGSVALHEFTHIDLDD